MTGMRVVVTFRLPEAVAPENKRPPIGLRPHLLPRNRSGPYYLGLPHGAAIHLGFGPRQKSEIFTHLSEAVSPHASAVKLPSVFNQGGGKRN